MAERTCSIEDCDGAVLCKKMCRRHYAQTRYREVQRSRTTEQRYCVRCSGPIPLDQARARYCSLGCRQTAKYVRRREKRAVGRVWNCLDCGTDISHLRSDAKYCSNACSDRIYYKKNIEAVRAAARQWVADNPMRAAATQRAYVEQNRVRISRYKQVWAYRNADKLREYHRVYKRQWLAKNKHRKAVYAHNRNKRSRINAGSLRVSPRDWRRLLNRYGYRCFYCGTCPETLHMDHVFPLSRGGRHAIGNLVPACVSCNSSKGSSFIIEWRRRRQIQLGAAS